MATIEIKEFVGNIPKEVKDMASKKKASAPKKGGKKKC